MDVIDGAAVHKMIDHALREFVDHGPFDVVIADSVVNSVDNLQSAFDVVYCLNGFCKRGGHVIFSGRTREYVESQIEATRAFSSKASRRDAEFLDKDGFSGFYWNGGWFYQLFLSQAQVLQFGKCFPGSELVYSVGQNGGYWFINVTRQGSPPLKEIHGAFQREFDLQWPQGQTVGRAPQALAALEAVGRKYPAHFLP
jgi:ParB family chromosome partitioning protein